MDKKYNHKICENINDLFNERNDLYQNKNNSKKKLFTIILPPPNVTGELHLGHAWNGTIQDALIRFKKIDGFNVKWICGMDHAGIATQIKYEKFLKENKQNVLLKKQDRNNFFESIYKWKNNNADTIRLQWKKMGFALDYTKEYFTLDSSSSKNVIESFVLLYKKGLIYREKKLVNWDVKLKTAISNIEVISQAIKTKMYYIKYFLKNSKDFLCVATTRPETIFVDECLFVNKDDKRYKKFINKIFINPLTKSELLLFTDDYVDKNFGTGVMKCTPAHDFNDYELGKKHNLKIVSCINNDGLLNDLCGGFSLMDRLDAREKIIEKLNLDGSLVKTEVIESNIGFSERSNVIVEPMLSMQWFLKTADLSKSVLAIQNSSNAMKIFPNKFNKNLIVWLNNMQDWCISRQLIWGHQIPAWYNINNNDLIYVGITPPKDEKEWVRDNDVLDTWFSSGLLPLTIGFYQKDSYNLFPTSVLVTGYDIIFFWLARILILSIFFKENVPFNNVYITGLIRDQDGKKMSKSLGNGINPNNIIDEYGADSLRLFFLVSSSPGNDLKFSYDKIRYYWSFLNKFWNSIRFILQDKKYFSNNKINIEKCIFFDKWILTRFYKMNRNFINNFNKFNFSIAIKYLLNFIWNDFCNTYLELSKNRLKNNNDTVILDIFFYIVKNCLILLNPICPFFTNYIYDKFIKIKPSISFEILSAEIFNYKCSFENDFIAIINSIRKFRLENNRSKKDMLSINITFFNKINFSAFTKNLDAINEILSSENVFITTNFSNEDLKEMKNGYLNDNFFVDFGASTVKKISEEVLKNKISILNDEIKRCDSMLNNNVFLAKASAQKILEEQNKKKEYLKKKFELEKILLSEQR